MRRLFHSLILLMLLSMQLAAAEDAFELNGVYYTDHTDSIIYTYIHKKTGLRVIHEDNANGIYYLDLIFRTPMQDEGDLNHVFEHTVMSGSRKYPSSYLFFDLVDRSLGADIGASTYTGFTEYHFSTPSREQAYIYADVLFSLIDSPDLISNENIYRREAVRYDLDSVDGQFVPSGTVFTEDIGYITSDPHNIINGILDSLYPGCYAANTVGRLPLNLEKNTYSPKPKPKLKNRVPVLSERDKEILQVLNEYKDNPLSNSEMAKRLGYKNANSYTYTKSHLIKKIRENANLKEEVSIKYSFVSYEMNRNKIDFNAKDIYILKKYTLVKNNNLIYNSVDNIANFTSKSKHTIYYHIDRLKDKVISNLENNIDLNTALWPNFIEAFIARNNFSIKKSIKVNEEDLHSISDTETTKDKILLGVNKLEESIFSEYVSKCDFKDKLILAFRLGYFNKRFFTSNEVANILNTDENYVIELTKECLSKSKEAFITYNKVLSKTKK